MKIHLVIAAGFFAVVSPGIAAASVWKIQEVYSNSNGDVRRNGI